MRTSRLGRSQKSQNQATHAVLAMAALLSLFISSCGGGGGGSSSPPPTSNPVPTITSLSPASATVGAATQTLTLNGTNFMTSSTVTYNNVAHTATYVSSTQLTISLSASDQATAGSYAVIVTNPSPGGGPSNAMSFTVSKPPQPVITSLTPIVAQAGQTIQIAGSGFGNTPPQTVALSDGSVDTKQCNTTTPSLIISNSGGGKDNWSAGHQTCSNTDAIGVYLMSWTDSQIVLGGFGTMLGTTNSSTYEIAAGDPITVTVAGPNGAGSGVYNTTVVPSSEVATLVVNIIDLPTGTPGSVAVTGPNGLALNVTSSQTITGAEGTYSVTAAKVVVGSNTYYATHPAQSVTLATGNSATLTVDYYDIVPNTTKVLDQTGMQGMTLSSDGSTITLPAASTVAQSLQAGDILAVGPASAAPNGLLLNIVNVTQGGGQISASTTQATLANAIQQANSQFTAVLSTSNMQTARILRNGVTVYTQSARLVETPTPGPHSEDSTGGVCANSDILITKMVNVPIGKYLSASGEIQLCGGLQIQVGVNWLSLQLNSMSATVTLAGQTQLSLTGEYSLKQFSKTVPLATIEFDPITVPIGPVPVVVVPEITIQVGANGNIGGSVSVGVSQTASVTGGFSYANGQVSPILQSTPLTFTVAPVGVDAGVTATAFVESDIDLLFYNVAGPYFDPQAYLQFDANVLQNPWWTLTGGLQGPTGLQLNPNLEVFGLKDLPQVSFPDLFDVTVTFAQADGGFFPAPTLTAITPNTAVSGSSAVTLALTGSNFVPDSVVNFNGTALATTFVDAKDLTAVLPAADLLNAGVIPVTVSNPDTIGAISNAVNFTVTAAGGSNPVPSISSLSPSSLTVGAAPQNLTINGTGFLSSSTVTINGNVRASAFVSASQLTIALTSADLATAGSFPVVVTNPSPGGGASNAVDFMVTSGSKQVTLAGLSFNPTFISPGTSTTGTVTLSAAAPAGGALVTLSSDTSNALPVPANVTVPAGSTTASFTATSSSSLTTSTQVSVTANYNNSYQSATVTVSLQDVTVSPPSAAVPVNGTQQFTANVTGTSNAAVNWSVNNLAGGDSTVGTISSSGLYTAPGSVPVPATVTVAATSQATPSASASASVTITTLPYNFITLAYAGNSQSEGTWAYEINGGGEVVGVYGPDLSAESGDYGSGGFLYDGGAYSVIEYPGTVDFQPCGSFAYQGAQGTAALGINNNGQIVGAYSDCTNNDASYQFLYSGGVFSPISYPGAAATIISRINNAGEIVGSYTDSNGVTHGFLYAGGTYSSIDYPGAASTQSSGINDSGQIVGSYTDSSGATHGFLYAGGNFSSLDYHGAASTAASLINNSGQITGSYTDSSGAGHGFLYAGGNFSSIDYPSATFTEPFGINNSGQIVGTYTDSSGANHGFLYSGGTFTPMDFPGGTGFTSPSGINDSGQIVGTYAPLPIDQGLDVYGFLATPQR